MGERWKRIDRPLHRGEELPPVSLYKVGSFYFVVEGNHRVSVAHYHGVEWIDAEVTAFYIPSGTEPRVETADASDTAEHTIRTRRSLAATAKELSAKRWRWMIALPGGSLWQIFRRA